MTDETEPNAWWSLFPTLVAVAGSFGEVGGVRATPVQLDAVISGVAGLAALSALARPRTSILVNGLAVSLYFALGQADGPIFLTVPVVAALAALRVRPRPLLTVLMPMLALMLATLIAGGWFYQASAHVTFWQVGGLIALDLGACVLGWWLTDRRAALREQAHRAAAEERLRMAQDLHDGVGHGLAVISMHAAVALHVLDNLDTDLTRNGVLTEKLRQSVEVVRDTGRESLDTLRMQVAAIIDGSRRPAHGLPDLEELLARVRTGGLAVDRRGDPGKVPEAVGQAVYAVVQESLTNVLWHADAGRATVALTRTREELIVTIQDNGHQRGRTATHQTRTIRSGNGMGIPGMRGRVERLGGTLESGFTSEGFRVRAVLPAPS